MMSMNHCHLLAAVVLATAGPPALLAAETFDYSRILPLANRGSGLWGAAFAPRAGEGELVGVRVEADWWEGPGDGRAGSAKKSAMEGIVYEVKRGEAEWVALPEVSRDLRLTARAAAPEGTGGLLGGSPGGEWAVRQKAGGGYPRLVRLVFTCRGDPLLVKDLRAASLTCPGLDPPPVLGQEHIHDRTDNKALKEGDEVTCVVVVENVGARKSKEVDLDVRVVPFGRTEGPRIGFAQVPRLGPGETAELRITGKIPAKFTTESGSFELLAIVDPRGTLGETETLNNSLSRAFTFEVPKGEEALPEDLRDR